MASLLNDSLQEWSFIHKIQLKGQDVRPATVVACFSFGVIVIGF
jgi:hypothetical protein